MNTTTSPSSSPRTRAQRALVLGGGGSAGNAWLIGVVAGLADAGLDVTTADVIVGTSAGATAAAQITGAPPARLHDDIVASDATLPASAAHRSGRGTTRSMAAHMDRTQRIIDSSSDPADMRRRMGAAAIELAASAEDAGPRWRTTVAARLPRPEWPVQRILLTAVDAATGEPRVFDRLSGVELVDAVAASCASGFAYRIGDRQYIDGGYRTNAENADLAAGFSKVLVLSPFSGASRTPASWGTHLSAQVHDLRSRGSAVETVFPDDESRAAFGDDVMDPARRRPAALAGFAQGRKAAEPLAPLWG
ncbi:patatin-like phospholipase family protein [Microbacterium sp. NPDC091662]|uniref:patatin-like phospholipase family protein n=1 Tax=Microbacterium sp. NPDC091662 TaxID=3364211 RepID=UPI00381149D7